MYSTIKDRKISIAIVGCGRISKNHFASIEKHKDNFDLIAVCDNDSDALEQAVKEHKVTGFLSLEELLKNTKPDVIVICTPSGLHPEQVIMIANHGDIHIVTEKPMATRWQDGVAMVKACDKARVRLFVVKQKS